MAGDLRFGDIASGGGGGPLGIMQLLIQLAIQGLILLVVLYVFLAFLDVLIFDGAIPIV